MPPVRLRTNLRERASPEVVTLPDGSVDRHYTVAAAEQRIETREAFGREVSDDAKSSFQLRLEAVEPGGQCVNAAQQLHALGSDVTCYGYLDDPVLDSLPFTTKSMGDPTLVYAFDFTNDDVMFAENGPVGEWTLDTLRHVADLQSVFTADAICCSNWISIPGMESAFHELADEDLPRIPFLLDPGDVVGAEPDRIEALREALGALQETFDVIYNANREEIRATTSTLPDPPESDLDRLEAIREATGIHAVVMHATEEAAVSTAEGRTRVENYDATRNERHTGAGDRFQGGLGYGLANDWDWDLALTCGNASAVHYVETGRTGTIDDLIAFVGNREG